MYLHNNQRADVHSGNDLVSVYAWTAETTGHNWATVHRRRRIQSLGLDAHHNLSTPPPAPKEEGEGGRDRKGERKEGAKILQYESTC